MGLVAGLCVYRIFKQSAYTIAYDFNLILFYRHSNICIFVWVPLFIFSLVWLLFENPKELGPTSAYKKPAETSKFAWNWKWEMCLYARAFLHA